MIKISFAIILSLPLLLTACGKGAQTLQSSTLNAEVANSSATGACVFNGQTYPNGASIPSFSAGSVAFGQLCSSVAETLTCTNGAVAPTGAFASCTVGAAASCNFNGQTIASGAPAVTAYQAPSVPFGQTCVSQPRSCTNGILSGSYAFSGCVVGQPAMCTFNTKPYANGTTGIPAFSAPTVPFGKLCSTVAETLSCANGVLSPANAYSSCTVLPAASCVFNGQTIASGTTANVKGYGQVYVPSGFLCSNYITTAPVSCNNGVYGSSGGLSPACDVNTAEMASNRNDQIFYDSGTLYSATDNGLSMTTNDGVSWVSSLPGISISSVAAVGKMVYAGTASGLQVSTDGGVTFTNKTTANGLGSNNVAYVTAVGSTVYVATSGGLSISTDAGLNFTNNASVAPATLFGLPATTIVSQSLAVVGNAIYLANIRLYISTDGGKTFAIHGSINDGPQITSVTAANGIVYGLTQSGVLSSADGFTNYTPLYPAGATPVTPYAPNGNIVAVGSSVYVATTLGISISHDGGKTFTVNLIAASMGHTVNTVYATSTEVYAGTIEGGTPSALFSSKDGGTTWKQIGFSLFN